MLRSVLAGGLLIAALCAGADARTLRIASANDPQSMDPHALSLQYQSRVVTQIYEGLVNRSRDFKLEPSLAESWERTAPLAWRFRLRAGVSFHDGTPFTADDAVFSIERAMSRTSQRANQLRGIAGVKKLDAGSIEIRTAETDAVLPEKLWLVAMMSKAWSEKNRVTQPQDYNARQETFAVRHANGTGPFMLERYEADARTVLKANPRWWGRGTPYGGGNLDEAVFVVIQSDATRLAALASKQVDLVLDPPLQDLPRLKADPSIKLVSTADIGTQYLALDQHRAELPDSGVSGRNPFKDRRVRQAMYQAVNVDAIRDKIMAGLAKPTGGVTPSEVASLFDAGLQTRLPYDLAAARKLMQEAGYGTGFEVTLDCPNNRYINDEELCIALAGMWAQIGISVKVNAMPRVLFFPKLERFETSLYLYGWGGAITDADSILTPVWRNLGEKGIGSNNYGRWRNDKFDALVAQQAVEPDPKKREPLVRAALQEFREGLHVIPLHRQVIPWAARKGLVAAHRPDNWLEVAWVKLPAAK